MSHWITPAFVIRTASGKQRMFQYLRKMNESMVIQWNPSQGLPWISAIPGDLLFMVIDMQDCFFSIPLQPKDCAKSAFYVLVLNHGRPDACIEWTLLSQKPTALPFAKIL